MEIRDILHGSIEIEPGERPIIDSLYFQRLRSIKQLGFAEFSFPSATHNRYIHSLGVMHTATMAYDSIFRHTHPGKSQTPDTECLAHFVENRGTFHRFRALIRLGAVLHDIGHGPLSHTTEIAMPPVSDLAVPAREKGKKGKATHEDYTLKIILDSSLTPAIEMMGKQYGFSPVHVAAMIDPQINVEDDFFCETISGEKVNFQPILHQLISSELDADRMDYLRRDSLYAGVSYGQFDFDWIVGNLTAHIQDGKCYLSLQHRALYTFEDFLISRFHMFLMVYFHYKSVIYDVMLEQYFNSPDCDYRLPTDIEKYCEATDTQLYSHLAQSKNPWAKRITEKHSYRLLVELHSGIPATNRAKTEQERLLVNIEKDLNQRGIHFLSAKSTGELSKYFRKPGDPIYVRYDNHYSAPAFIPIGQCTDLFQRYNEKRSISRIYVSPNDYPKCHTAGRHIPFPYE